MSDMTGYFRYAIVALSTFLFGCTGDIDGDLLLKRYSPAESAPVKTTITAAAIVLDSPADSKGPYFVKVRSSLGFRWLRYLSDGRELYASGKTTISCAITPEGRVRDIKVVKNTSNSEFVAMCRQVLEESKFGPPTEDLLKQMKDGKLRLTLGFIYSYTDRTSPTSSDRPAP